MRFITSRGSVILQSLHPAWGWIPPLTDGGEVWKKDGSFWDEDNNWSLKLTQPIITEEDIWPHKGYNGVCRSESFSLSSSSLQCLIHWQPNELDHYALFRSRHLFTFHSIHKYLLASSLVPFGGSRETLPRACLLVSGHCQSLDAPHPLTCSYITPTFASLYMVLSLCLNSAFLNPGRSHLEILNFITLLRPFFQVRPHS